MPKALTFFTLALFAAIPPASAHQRSSHPLNCDIVRAYVAQVGLVQARALAMANGMTASQERRAKACLGVEQVAD